MSPEAHAAPFAAAALVLLGAAVPAPSRSLAAQEPGDPTAVDTAGLATGPCSTMEMLHERTIFGVDVLHLALRFGPETAGELRDLVRGRRRSGVPDDSLAALAADTRDAVVRSRFLRDVSYEQWLDGISSNLSAAWKGGYLGLDEAGFEGRMEELRRRYAPLEGRGIREGDIVWYRIRGDTVRFRIEARDGARVVDATRVGASYRRSVLWSYLAPGSDFREKLIGSLFRRDGG